MEKDSKKGMNRHVQAVIFVLLEALGFSLMSFFVKLAGDLPAMEKAFFRNIVALCIAAVLMARSKADLHIPKKAAFPLFMRCLMGFLGITFNFWAIGKLQLADANILNKMAPFFAILMSVFILKEIPSVSDLLCVIAAFIGAVFVVHPTAGIASLPAFAGLFSGFSAGTAYTYLRKTRQLGVNGPEIVFCFSLFSTIGCLPFILLHHAPLSTSQFLSLLGAGGGAALGQIAVTQAYTLAPAKEISVFDYSQVIFAAILGFLFFREIPDVLSWIGYAVIITAAVVHWNIERRRS